MIFLETNQDFHRLFQPKLLERAAQAALSHPSAPAEADLTLALTGDAEIQALNREFLGIDAPTDVLSFPAEETDPETGRRYLGDVIISYPRAEAQAQRAGHPVEAELQLLAVHGVLHLLGYDHAEPDEKARMWAIQSTILTSLGLSLSLPDKG